MFRGVGVVNGIPGTIQDPKNNFCLECLERKWKIKDRSGEGEQNCCTSACEEVLSSTTVWTASKNMEL